MRGHRGVRGIGACVSLLLLVCVSLAAPGLGAAQAVADLEREARALFDEERYAEAAQRLQAILAADPDHRAAAVLLSFALARLDNRVAAIAQTRRALDRFPTNVRLQLLLAGLLAQEEGTRLEAIRRYEAVLQRDPQEVLALIGLGEAFRAQGRPFDAIGAFSRATARAPDDPRIQVRLGQLHAALGDLGESRKHFQRAYALRRSNVDAVRSLAILGDVEDQPEDALRYYRELLDLYPTDASVLIAVRLAEERLAEPRFPTSLAELERFPLEAYVGALPQNSKQLQHRREQLDAMRWRSITRFLPSFFVAPSRSKTEREAIEGALISTRDDSKSLSLSFGWNLADIFANPYSFNITGLQADYEAIRANLTADVTTTYYQRLQNILEYRRLQRALALDPQNAQLRQSKLVTKYAILNLTERLKILTALPW
jgi:tetratricopeptide (TPR) repeat protein